MQATPDGLVVRLLRSNGDQSGVAEIGIPRGRAAEICPMRALETWVGAAGIRFGPLFRPVSGRGIPEPRALSGEAVRKLVQQLAARAGVQGTKLEPFSAHSLRAGFITEAYRRGLDDETIMAHARHKDLRTMRRYVRREKLVTGSAAGRVGL